MASRFRQFGEEGARRIVRATKQVERLSQGSPFQAYGKAYDDYMPGPIPFIVDLVQVGGSAGSGTTTCSFTYNVLRFGTMIPLASALTPLRGRDPNTQYIAATQGYAYQELDGTIQLAEAFEKIATELCDGDGLSRGIDDGDPYLP